MLPLCLPCAIISLFHLSLLTAVNITVSILTEGTSASRPSENYSSGPLSIFPFSLCSGVLLFCCRPLIFVVFGLQPRLLPFNHSRCAHLPLKLAEFICSRLLTTTTTTKILIHISFSGLKILFLLLRQLKTSYWAQFKV